MANTLTSLIPDLYEALDVVSRELVGFIPAVTWDASAERAAVNQPIRSFYTPAAAVEDVSPGQLPPDDGDQTMGNVSLMITKSRAAPFRWSGEEQKGVNSSGPGYANIRRDQIAQAMRALTNEIEAFVGLTALKGSSRATGTAGTAPFASALDPAADVRKMLDDNGCPMGDRHMIINTSAGTNLRKLTQLTKALEAGTTDMRSQGVLLDLFGFNLRESAGVQLHTKGSGTGYLVNLVAGYPVGSSSVVVDTGSGTVLAGDVVTNATTTADTNKYVLGADIASATIAPNLPGLQVAWVNNDALSIGNSYTGNMAFHRSAIVLVTRAPALPEEGDSADDRIMITDPRSGLSFEVSMYRQYKRVRYEVACAYGAAVIKSAHVATLMG